MQYNKIIKEVFHRLSANFQCILQSSLPLIHSPACGLYCTDVQIKPPVKAMLRAEKDKGVLGRR